MGGGWLKLYRALPDSRSGRRGGMAMGAMAWLLCRAEWRDGHSLAVGQVHTTQAVMCAELRYTRDELRGILDALEADGFIRRRPAGKNRRDGVVIDIANYSDYQAADED